MAVSFVCDDDDRIFTEEEAAELGFRCPDCRADLDVIDDPEGLTAEQWRERAKSERKSHDAPHRG